jgi:hypothetical protein
MTPQTTKIAVVVILSAGAGAVVGISHLGRPSHAPTPSPQETVTAPSPVIVHTAAWYVAHPDILKQDEQRCAGDAASLPQAACQNAASADFQISEIDMKNAAAANQNQKSP